jgi:hypothetical protein
MADKSPAILLPTGLWNASPIAHLSPEIEIVSIATCFSSILLQSSCGKLY